MMVLIDVIKSWGIGDPPMISLSPAERVKRFEIGINGMRYRIKAKFIILDEYFVMSMNPDQGGLDFQRQGNHL